jgi:hypothetical protein
MSGLKRQVSVESGGSGPKSKKAASGKGRGAAASKAAAPASSKDVPPEKEKVAGMSQLIQCMGQLTLANARQVSTLRSILVSVCLFDKESSKDLVTIYRKVTQDYNRMHKEYSPQEKQDSCSVHIYLWLEFLGSPGLKDSESVKLHLQELAALSAAKSAEMKAAFDLLQASREESKRALWTEPPAGWLARESVAEHIKIFRLSKCFNKNLLRLELSATSVSGKSVAASLLHLLCTQYKGQVKHGKAPKGKLERKLEKSLGAGKGKQQPAAATLESSDSDM